MSTTKDKIHPIVYSYDADSLISKLAIIIERYTTPDTWQWLKEKSSQIRDEENIQHFMIAFAATPRKTGKQLINLSEEEIREIQQIRPHLTIQHWPIDRLCRVWFLMHLDTMNPKEYIRVIESLFPTAEMNELIALYSSLPLLAFPENWRAQCAEGIRNNIADVLESIMCNNPYPSENLDEPAWNQLVLKAIFTEKPINQIVNLELRANQSLANTLSDYAHERWAAHRDINPLLWRCVGKFMNEKIFPDIMRIALSENSTEREAAALACSMSTYPPAKELVDKNDELRSIIKSGMTWDDIGKKLEKNSS